MHNKIFFTDLDGTLLTTDKKVSPKTYDTLRRWTSAGHKLVLCSGRALDSVSHTKEVLGLNFPGMYLVGCNGGEIYDCSTAKLLLRRALSFEDLDRIMALAKEQGIYCQTYTDTHILAPVGGEEIAYYRGRIHTPYIITQDFRKELTKEPCKCLAIELKDLDKLEQFRLSALERFGDHLNILYSNPNYLELFPGESGKGTAVKWLCEYLQLPMENALAAGDEANDISMIEIAGIGIAMANAKPEVKKAADVVTSLDNDHDGLVSILEKEM